MRVRKDEGGVIVNVSLIEVFLFFVRGFVYYDVVKFGVVVFMRVIVREYGKKIRVNVVVLGGIEMEGVKRFKKEVIMKFDIEKIGIFFYFNVCFLMGCFGEFDEVVRVIFFFVSDLVSYVNGVIVLVDGGFLFI